MKRPGELRPLGRNDLLTRELDGEFFLYDPVTDRVALINQSAAVVFDLCNGSLTEDEIVAEVKRLYAAGGEQVDNDVRATLADFAARGLTVRATARDHLESDE